MIRKAHFLLWLSLKFIVGASGQDLPPGWDFTITPTFHPIAIPLTADPSLFGDSISPGDYIGVFFNRNDSLICAGASLWPGNENTAVVAFGDDNMTTLKDGFLVNETINWKIYSWEFEEEFIASATYDSTMLFYDGKFHPGGLSSLTDLFFGEAMQVSAQAIPGTICIGSTVQLTVLANGGSGAYSFSWFSVPEGFTSGEQNPSTTPLETTSYIVVVQDGYHSRSDTTTVTVVQLPQVMAGIDEAICAGDDFQTNGYAEHFTSVEWSTSGDGSFDNPFYLGATYFPGDWDLQSGTVSLMLTVYPVAPCTMSMNDTMTLHIHSIPSVDAGIDHWIAYGTSTQLNSTVDGGSGEYLYSWEPAEYLEDPEEEDPLTLNLYQSTIFILTGTDALTSCHNIDTAIVYITGGPLTVTASASPGTICIESTSQLMALPGGGSGNYAYQWSSDPSGYDSEEQDPVVSPDQTTTYTITVDDGFNTASDQAIIYVVSQPEACAGEDSTIPYGTSTTLHGSATGGSTQYAYYWSPAQYLVDPSVDHPMTVNLIQSVVFILTVTDLMTLCGDQDTVMVSVEGELLQVNVTATPGEVCAGESSQLNALASGGAGSYTYAWTSDPPGFFSDQPDPVVIPGGTTAYFVDVFDGFSTVTDYITVEVFPIPVVGIFVMPDDTVCAGEVIRLDASTPGGEEYYWLPGGQTGPVIEVDSAGTGFGSATYRVYVTTLDGCTGVDSVEVTFLDCVGVQENASPDTKMYVYPNPAREEVWIQLRHASESRNNFSDTYKIDIRDITGRKMLNLTIPFYQSIYSFSVRSFPQGVYIVILKKDHQILSTGKMVVLNPP
ncbi:MAG: T9SS type A sorting domain-containing protein [Bacteroidales bacterium]|nr:T9SS type A sorting domain-containing protein [Lentimicrobiaceae bacterium]MDD5694521.1 T9SS type A sorting domain-containing protein [Bacteroidales bacterium]